MAEIYTPWSNVGAEYEPEDNSATVAYAEGYDQAEDAGEMPEAEGSEHGGHADLMAEALSIMNDQQRTIAELTAKLAGTST